MPRSYSKKPNPTLHKIPPIESSDHSQRKALNKNAFNLAAEKISSPLSELEQYIGHKFFDKKLIIQALTHRSYSQEVIPPEADNERLEFLGDSVLQMIVTKRLWAELEWEDEGVLTRRRSEKVSGRALANVAREMDLSKYIRLGKGELKTGGRQKSSILADVLEALVGAIYLDAGYEKCAEVVEYWLWGDSDVEEGDILADDYKSKLQQELQRTDSHLPVYHVTHESGPEHDKIFNVEVRHSGKVLGKGEGRSKKEAEQIAARESIEMLVGESGERMKG